MDSAISQRAGHDVLLAATAGALGMALYVFTCAPGVLWQDSAMFQFRVWNSDLRGDLGLPLAHPTYILLARAFSYLPLGDFAYRVNLFSAVSGAAALGTAMYLLLQLTRRPDAAAIGTLSLAVSHTFWTHSVIAEVYNLYVFALLIELTLLHRFLRQMDWRWFAAALLVNGLNYSNHVMAILHGPAYVVILAWAMKRHHLLPRHVVIAILAWLTGSLPYTAIIIQNIREGQPTTDALLESLTGGRRWSGLVTTTHFPVVIMLKRTAQYFILNFPTPILLLAPYAAWNMVRDPTKRLFTAGILLMVFITGFVFALRYPVPDQFVFFTPCYVITSILIGSGAAMIIKQSRGRAMVLVACALFPVAVYEAAPHLMRKYNIALGTQRDIPFRDTYTYFIRPRKNGEVSGREFGLRALNQAAPDGLLIADSTVRNMLVYTRDVLRVQPNVTLNIGEGTVAAHPSIDVTPELMTPFVQRGAAFICNNKVPYIPEWMLTAYDFVPDGILYRLVPKVGPPKKLK